MDWKFTSEMHFLDYVMVGLAAVVFLLYVKFSPHCFWIDEARDMFITRGFLENGQLKYFDETYMQHPFGFFVVLGLSSLIFGLNDSAGQIAVILLGTGTVVFTYLLGKELFNRLTGLAAAVILAFQPLFWFMTDRVLNDVPQTFFLTAGFYFFVKSEKSKENKWLYLSGFLFAYAMLTKVSSIVILPTLFFYLIYKKKDELKYVHTKKFWKKNKKYVYALLIFFLTFSIWMVRNYFSVGYFFPFDDYFGRLTPGEHNIDVQPFLFYIINYKSVFRTIPAILFLFGFFATLLRKFKGAELPLIWVFFYLLLMSMQTVKVPRYMIPAFPMMFIIAGHGLSWFVSKIRRQRPIAYTIVLVILVLTTYFSYAEASLLIPSRAQSFCGLKETGQYLAQISDPNDTIMAASNTQIHWYSDRWVVSFPQNTTVFNDYVEEKSVDYIVVDLWERTAPGYVLNNGQLWNPYFLNNTKYKLIWAYPLYENNFVTFVYEVKE